MKRMKREALLGDAKKDSRRRDRNLLVSVRERDCVHATDGTSRFVRGVVQRKTGRQGG